MNLRGYTLIGTSPSPGLPPAFTLIEVIIMVALASVIMLVLTTHFHAALVATARQRDLHLAMLLADDLMHEIRSKAYQDAVAPLNGPEPGETNRWYFDDVDDYTQWTSAPPRTIEGAVMSNYIGFTEAVTVTNVLADNFNSNATTNTGFKRITVTIYNANVAVSNVSVVSSSD